MPEDYGLLTGLAEGLKSGISAYTDQQKRNEDLARLKADRELQKKKYRAELMSKGLIEKPNGDLEYDKESSAYKKGLLDTDYREAQLENLNANTQFLKGGKITDLDLAKGGMMRDPMTGRMVLDPSSPAGQKLLEESRLRNAQEQKIMQDIALGKANEGLIGARTEGQNRKNKSIGAPGAMKLDPAQKKQVDFLAGKQAAMTSAKIQLSEFLRQVEDPSLPDGQKLQAAMQAAKIMNDPVNSDAVSQGELSRVQAYLEAAPNFVKGFKLGPDMKGFSKSLRDVIGRAEGAESRYAEAVKGITSGKPASPSGLLNEGPKFPMTLRKGGKAATVQNAQELKEAQAEGWK